MFTGGIVVSEGISKISAIFIHEFSFCEGKMLSFFHHILALRGSSNKLNHSMLEWKLRALKRHFGGRTVP